jgi:hypothetical protein
MPLLGWRWVLGLASIPVGLLVVFFALVFESPRYVLLREGPTAAMLLLKRIAQYNGCASVLDGLELYPVVRRSTVVRASSAVLLAERSPLVTLPTASGAPDAASRHVYPPRTRWACCSTPPSEWQVVQTFAEILSPAYRRTMVLLWFIWLANALTYYGVVLFAAQETVSHRKCGARKDVPPLTNADYQGLLVNSVADLPGIIIPALLVDRIGRRWTQGIMFLATSVFLLLLLPTHDTAHAVFGFLGRMCSLAAFTVCYLFTPEVVPTRLRASAFGVANAWGRLGGILAPFVGDALVQRGYTVAAILIFASVCAVGAVATYFITIETAGRALDAATEQRKPSHSDDDDARPLPPAPASTPEQAS